jgi:hypothetical protein
LRRTGRSGSRLGVRGDYGITVHAGVIERRDCHSGHGVLGQHLAEGHRQGLLFDIEPVNDVEMRARASSTLIMAS